MALFFEFLRIGGRQIIKDVRILFFVLEHAKLRKLDRVPMSGELISSLVFVLLGASV